MVTLHKQIKILPILLSSNKYIKTKKEFKCPNHYIWFLKASKRYGKRSFKRLSGKKQFLAQKKTPPIKTEYFAENNLINKPRFWGRLHSGVSSSKVAVGPIFTFSHLPQRT